MLEKTYDELEQVFKDACLSTAKAKTVKVIASDKLRYLCRRDIFGYRIFLAELSIPQLALPNAIHYEAIFFVKPETIPNRNLPKEIEIKEDRRV